MIKGLFLFFIIITGNFFCSEVVAGRLVLLSAIHDIEEYRWNRNLYSALERKFRRNFPEDNIKVVHHARQEDLYAELNDPQNTALFWLSHSSSHTSNPVVGNLIVDSARANVLPVFQKIHPNMRWVGIIGCKARPLAKKLEREGLGGQRFYAQNSVVTPT